MSTRRSWQEVREELVAGDPELDGEIRAGAAAIVMQHKLAELRRSRQASQDRWPRRWTSRKPT